MSYEIKSISFKSTDSIHTLKGKMYIPSGDIKGLFHIVHGKTEYIGRYDNLMSHLAENGYIAFGYDHLGHGETANDDSELGFIASKNGWKLLVDDVIAFGDNVRKEYSSLPYYLFGHSMGSFIARLSAAKMKNVPTKLIICGTSGKNPLAKIGLFITSLMAKIKGERATSNLVNSMAFGSYNKKFPENSPYAWLTKKTELVEKYGQDKYCTFDFSVSAMHDLIKLMDACNEDIWFQKMNKDLPIFLISGDMDPVGNYSKGVIEVYDKLKAKNANVKMKLYKNCRHEIHNDTSREEMYQDILDFIEG